MSDDLPWVGVSPCLLGVLVRYDGAAKRHQVVLELGERVRWVPVCPEAGAGMGTPREPARVLRAEGGDRFVGVRSGEDRTPELQAFIDSTVASLPWDRLCGWVLKARSPSCGLGSTPFFRADVAPGDVDASPAGVGDGLWAAALARRDPGLPLIDELDLADDGRRAVWLRRVQERARRVR